MHLFGHTFDHDYYFELPREGERDTQSMSRCFTSHHRLFRAFPRANRTFSTARNPIPCVASNTNVLPVSEPDQPCPRILRNSAPQVPQYSIVDVSRCDETSC